MNSHAYKQGKYAELMTEYAEHLYREAIYAYLDVMDNARSYPFISRYTVSGTYHTATRSRHTRTTPPITAPIRKFRAKTAMLPPKERPPGMIHKNIRCIPKGRPHRSHNRK